MYIINNIHFSKQWDLEFKKIGEKFIGTTASDNEVTEYANKMLFEFISDYKKSDNLSLISLNNIPGTSVFTFFDSLKNSWRTIKLEELKNKVVKINRQNDIIISIGVCHELITWLMGCRIQLNPKSYYYIWGKSGSVYTEMNI